jgi:hypothetical protein
MNDDKENQQEGLVQELWSAIFSGTRLRHIGSNDSRVFVLKSIVWGQQESKVVDIQTGKIFRFPWAELEFLDPIDVGLPGIPAAPTNIQP